MNTQDTIETISNADLVTVTGGGKAGLIQKAYKAWTGSKKNGSPQEIYKAGKEIATDITAVGVGSYALKKGNDMLNKSESESTPTPTSPSDQD